MALDCWAALMSDLAGEAEGMESFVGPAGFTPSTVLLGSTAGPGVGGNVLDNGGINGLSSFFSVQALKTRLDKTSKTPAIFTTDRLAGLPPVTCATDGNAGAGYINGFVMVRFLVVRIALEFNASRRDQPSRISACSPNLVGGFPVTRALAMWNT